MQIFYSRKKAPIVTLLLTTCHFISVILSSVHVQNFELKATRSRGIPYEFLINVYEKYCNEDSEVMVNEVKSIYPDVYIGRNDRFVKTMQRIVSPTLPSILDGQVSITGNSLDSYRKKKWIPRIRNLSKESHVIFMGE